VGIDIYLDLSVMMFRNTNVQRENTTLDAFRTEKHSIAPSALLAKQFAAPNNLFVQLKSNNDATKNRAASNYPLGSTAPSPHNLNLECNETL
jgi:hypothetical protein